MKVNNPIANNKLIIDEWMRLFKKCSNEEWFNFGVNIKEKFINIPLKADDSLFKNLTNRENYKEIVEIYNYLINYK